MPNLKRSKKHKLQVYSWFKIIEDILYRIEGSTRKHQSTSRMEFKIFRRGSRSLNFTETPRNEKHYSRARSIIL